MNEEELWYIVARHTNIRMHSKDGPVIHSDYESVRKSAANLSTSSESWYVPIRVSEYHEMGEIMTVPTVSNMEAFLDQYKMFSDLMLERVKESEYIPPNRRLCEEDRIALFGIYMRGMQR